MSKNDEKHECSLLNINFYFSTKSLKGKNVSMASSVQNDPITWQRKGKLDDKKFIKFSMSHIPWRQP